MRSCTYIVLLLLTASNANSQPFVEWEHHYGPRRGETVRKMAPTIDGGFICTGSIDSVVGWDTWADVYLLKVDSMGNAEWSRSWNWAELDQAYDVKQTRDGGYVLAGVTGFDSGEGRSAFIMKTDTAGQLIWQQTLALRRYNYARAVFETQEGYLALGSAAEWADWDTVFVSQLTVDGTIDTTKLIPFERGAQVLGASQADDGEIVLAGALWSPYGYNMFAMRLSTESDIIWARRYPLLSSNSVGYDLELTDDAIVLGGFFNFWEASDVLVLSVDWSGDTLWTFISRGDGIDAIRDIVLMPDGSLAACGITSSFGNGAEDFCVWRLGQTGTLLWTQSYGAEGSDRLYASVVDANARILLGGTTTSFNAVDGDAYLVRLSADTTACGSVILESVAGPPTWAFGLVWQSGNLYEFSITGLPNEASAHVGGTALENWTVLPNGDGNDGDSVIFVANFPLESGHIDTFFLNLPDGWCTVRWTAGCLSDTIRLEHGGVLSALPVQDSRIPFRVIHETGAVSRVIITHLREGTTGMLSGAAMDTWSELANGDGNDGDSIIFVANAPLLEGSIDTLWIQTPNLCDTLLWTIGCRSDSFFSWAGVIDSVSFSGAYFVDIVLTILTVNESGIEGYEIWRGSNMEFTSLLGTITAVNLPGEHEYSYNAGRLWNGVQLLLVGVDEFGCRHEYRDLVLTVGVNVPIDELSIHTPACYSLIPYPNPFNPSTTVSFTLPRQARARLVVFDVLGREVRVLADENFAPGEHRILFNGSDLPSGIYFARLQSGEFVATQKLLLLK